MKILAIETSSIANSVALLNNDAVSSIHQIAPMQQAQLLLPAITNLMAEASLSFEELDAVAFGCGPGSFTGMRIACSTAQGIGFAANRPLIAISSLAAMAQAAYMSNPQLTHVLVALNAYGGQLYWAFYQVNPVTQLVELCGQEQISHPDYLKIPVNSIDKGCLWYGVGDGFQVYASVLINLVGENKLQVVNEKQLPTAEALLKLAQAKFACQDWIEPFNAIPAYLH